MFSTQSFEMQRLYNDIESANTLKQFLVNRHYANKSHDAQVGVNALSAEQRFEIERSFAAIMGMPNSARGQIESYSLYFQRDRAHVAESVVVAAHQAIVAMVTADPSTVVTIPSAFSSCELTAAVTAAICDVPPSAALQHRNQAEFTALLDRLKQLINSNRQQFQVLLEQKFKEIKGYDTNTDYVEPLAVRPLAALGLQSQKTLFFTLYKLIANYVFEKFNLPKEYYAFQNYDDRYQGGEVAFSSTGQQQPQSSGQRRSIVAPSSGDVALPIVYSPAPLPEQLVEGSGGNGGIMGEMTPLLQHPPGSASGAGTFVRSCSWRPWLMSGLSTVFVGCIIYSGWSTNRSLQALLNFLTNAASYGAELPSKWELFLRTHGRTLFSDPNDQGNLEVTVGRLVAFITTLSLGVVAISYLCNGLRNYVQQRRRHVGYAPIAGSSVSQPLLPIVEEQEVSGRNTPPRDNSLLNRFTTGGDGSNAQF